MNRSVIFCILLLVLMTGCDNWKKQKQTQQQKQEGLGKGRIDEKNVYTVREIGWTIQLPANWEVLSQRDNRRITDKGEQEIEENSHIKIDVSNLISLVAIQKDRFNSFQSTMQPFNEEKDGDYDQTTIATHKMITDLYKAKGIPYEQSLGAVRIDGIMFDRLEIKLYDKDKKKVILEQKLFNALVNDYDFSMVVNFNNADDEELLTNMVMDSKFAKQGPVGPKKN